MRRMVVLSAGLLLAFSVAAPAVAADPPDYVFDAGQACEFALGFSGDDVGPNIYREFTDGDGTVVWSLLTGRGGVTTFMNMDTEATFSIRATGTVGKTVYHPDGSMTSELMGGWIIIMFPTDDPPGPSTTQVLGRVVMETSADYVSTIKSMSGRQVDICAALT